RRLQYQRDQFILQQRRNREALRQRQESQSRRISGNIGDSTDLNPMDSTKKKEKLAADRNQDDREKTEEMPRASGETLRREDYVAGATQRHDDLHEEDYLREKERLRIERMRKEVEAYERRNYEERLQLRHLEESDQAQREELRNTLQEPLVGSEYMQQSFPAGNEGQEEVDFETVDELAESLVEGEIEEDQYEGVIEGSSNKLTQSMHKDNINRSQGATHGVTSTSEKVRKDEKQRGEQFIDIEKEIDALDRRLTLLSKEGYLHAEDARTGSTNAGSSDYASFQKGTEMSKRQMGQNPNVDSRYHRENTQYIFDGTRRKETYMPTHGVDSREYRPLYGGYYENSLPRKRLTRRQLQFEEPRDAEQRYQEEYPYELGYNPIQTEFLPPFDYGIHRGYDDKPQNLYPPRDSVLIAPLPKERYESLREPVRSVVHERVQATIKKETGSGKPSLTEERKRKDLLLKAQEEELIRKEVELNEMEARIKEQEELRDSEEKPSSIDYALAQRAIDLQRRRDELKAKEDQLRKREKSLQISKSTESERNLVKKGTVDQATMTDFDTSKKSAEESLTHSTATETYQETVEKLKVNQTTMTDSENVEKTELKEKKATYENTYLYPKITQFSGEEPKQKNEASYEEWKYEVNCLRKEGDHSESVIAQAIRKSLRGQAKKVLLPLGTSAKLPDIMGKLEGVFGNVATGESVLREFYTACQSQDETVAAWGLRLEELLQKAMDKGHIKQEEKNDMLREKFWRALRSDRLKNATRVHYESITNFELLRRAVRAEEHEMKISTGVRQQQMKADISQEKEEVEDSKTDKILARLESLEKQMKYANRGRYRYQYRSRDNYSRQDEKQQEKEKPKTDTANPQHTDTTKKDF
ncbi:MAG: hypothetical protein AB2693_16240, partial [Candidatus Thiodiazotropha sp.]